MSLSPEKINPDLQNSRINSLRLNTSARSEMSLAVTVLDQALQRFLGKSTPPAPQKAWDYFLVLPEERQVAALSAVRGLYSFVCEAMDAEIEATDESSMLHFAMNRFGLLHQELDGPAVKPNDIVEIFDENGLQIYRSFSTFAMCNYSLLELTAYPWWELYERPSMLTERFQQIGADMMAGKYSHVDVSEWANYTIKELLMDMPETFAIQDLYISKLRSVISRRTYFLSVKNIRPLPNSASGLRFI